MGLTARYAKSRLTFSSCFLLSFII
jgi:hypothetical protein